VRHARGTGIHEGTDEEITAAVELARTSEVAVLVLGERSGLTTDSTTGEFRDRHDLGLMGRQQELLQAVVGTGTPVVLVVVSGRPLALPWAAEHCAAIVYAWVPGDAGSAAVAATLAGDVNPGGKLPVSMPRHVGQLPLSYRHHPTGGRSNPKGDYVDGSTRPLWPFGFGRSYTSFELSNLCVSQNRVPTRDGEFEVSVDVTNVGARAGDEVVQLYVRDEAATVARPVKELRGFRRVTLAAGERRTVRFRLSTEQLAYVGADYRRVIEPGRVRLFAGTSSQDLPLEAAIELEGPTIELLQRCRYLTITTED
jgi:beta-glucosidase